MNDKQLGVAELLPRWCRTEARGLSVKTHMDHGDFGCKGRGRYVYCSNCWTCGPTYNTDAEALEGWNKMRSSILQQPVTSEQCGNSMRWHGGDNYQSDKEIKHSETCSIWLPLDRTCDCGAIRIRENAQ
jgi:hypothetical protein